MTDSTKPTNPKDAVGSNKAGIHYVSASVMSEVGLAMLEGGCKYGGHNYRAAGVRASVYVDAVWRHLFQQWWDQGEDLDADSGLSHITKAIAGLIVMRDSMIQGNFYDDRPIRSKGDVGAFNGAARAIIAKYPDPKQPFTEASGNYAEPITAAEVRMADLAMPDVPVNDIARSLKAINSVLAGERNGLYLAFSWDSSPQRFEYWADRREGKAELSADDIAYLKRVKAHFERNIPK